MRRGVTSPYCLGSVPSGYSSIAPFGKQILQFSSQTVMKSVSKLTKMSVPRLPNDILRARIEWPCMPRSLTWRAVAGWPFRCGCVLSKTCGGSCFICFVLVVMQKSPKSQHGTWRWYPKFQAPFWGFQHGVLWLIQGVSRAPRILVANTHLTVAHAENGFLDAWRVTWRLEATKGKYAP